MGARAESLGQRVEPREWQVAAASDILRGRDVCVVTATGSGKSMCYQAIGITRPTGCIMVLTPLLALMDNQVLAARFWGLTAVGLNATARKLDPTLLQRAASGEFQVVIICPEFLDMTNYAFKKLVSWRSKGGMKVCGSVFAQRLLVGVIDKAHLCEHWYVSEFF